MATDLNEHIMLLLQSQARVETKLDSMQERIQEDRESSAVQFAQLRAEIKRIQEEKAGAKPWHDYRVWVIGIAVLFGGTGAGTVVANVMGMQVPATVAKETPPTPEVAHSAKPDSRR